MDCGVTKPDGRVTGFVPGPVDHFLKRMNESCATDSKSEKTTMMVRRIARQHNTRKERDAKPGASEDLNR